MPQNQQRIPIKQKFADVIFIALLYNKFPSYYFSFKELRQTYSEFISKNVSAKEIGNLSKRLQRKALIWDRLHNYDKSEYEKNGVYSDGRFCLSIEVRHLAGRMAAYL